MAGIGFELKKMLQDESWLGLTKTYVYAGIISSGPWVLSILGIMLVGLLGAINKTNQGQLVEFLVSVTYLMSISLILTGLLQLMFTRFIADRLYEKNQHIVLPNLMGAMYLTTAVSGALGLVLGFTFFYGQWVYFSLMLVNFIVLCNLWIVLVFVSGMREYHYVLWSFLGAYGGIVVLSLGFHNLGANGLLAALLLGHTALLFSLFFLILKNFEAKEWVRFDFLNRSKIFPILILVGVLFNLGVWIDKWIFWLYPDTSDVIGSVLRASVIYDLPIFLAYLSIIPGMASFLLRVETDFVESYKSYYQAINQGCSLDTIEQRRSEMVDSIRRAFAEITKIQAITIIILFLLAEKIIAWLGLSPLYVHLYYVDLLATGVQVLFMATLSVSFYFNLLKLALQMVLLLFIFNLLLTLLSLFMGAAFYGYGFALALLISTLRGMSSLSDKLNRLEYLTYMMQR